MFSGIATHHSCFPKASLEVNGLVPSRAARKGLVSPAAKLPAGVLGPFLLLSFS